jgi:hypothetical protein
MRENFSALTVPKYEATEEFIAFLDRIGHKSNWDSQQKKHKAKEISADWVHDFFGTYDKRKGVIPEHFFR